MSSSSCLLGGADFSCSFGVVLLFPSSFYVSVEHVFIDDSNNDKKWEGNTTTQKEEEEGNEAPPKRRRGRREKQRPPKGGEKGSTILLTCRDMTLLEFTVILCN